jgi:glycosyltransferase involved in cell wall biosynthesis
MRIVSVNHAAVTSQAMGGEVSMHRQMVALAQAGHDVTVLATRGVERPHEYGGVRILPLTDIGHQLMELDPQLVIGFHEESILTSIAATAQDRLSVTRIDAPPRYGRGLLPAVTTSDAAIYNTVAAAREWGEPQALVIHPPMPELPGRVSPSRPGDPYLLTSNLINKGVEVTLELAARMPHQPFWIIRSPAEPTHGYPGFAAKAARLPNVKVLERVLPHEMPELYRQARLVLVPSRYETYGMAGLEGLAHGRPCLHVRTDHALEGVGPDFCVDTSLASLTARIEDIESSWKDWSRRARTRAEEVQARQVEELDYFGTWVTMLRRAPERLKTARKNRIRRRVRMVR